MVEKSEGNIWAGHGIPPLEEFVKYLDTKLMLEIEHDSTGALAAMFNFFDSDPENPLTPRELLEFCNSLSEEERLSIMLEFC
jgi:hypothetical protein